MDNSEKLTFKFLIEKGARDFSLRPSLCFVGGECLNYLELEKKSKQLASYLLQRGLQKGDTVGIISKNQPNWGVVFLACVIIGAVVVPVSEEYTDDQIVKIINHAKTKIIFVSEKNKNKIGLMNHDYLKELILIDDFVVVKNSENKELINYRIDLNKIEILENYFSNIEINENDLAVISYTSGTMGKLKGVMLTNKNIIFEAQATIKCASLNSSYRSLSLLPLSHMIELTLGLAAPLWGGSSVYYLKNEIDEASLKSAFKIVKPTLIVAVPLVIEKIYKNNILPVFTENKIFINIYSIKILRPIINRIVCYKLKEVFGGKIRLFSMGGSGLSADVEELLRRIKFPYALGYGLTEAAPLLTGPINAERFIDTPFQSSGRVLDGVEIRIKNHDKYNIGEIQARGNNITKGYYQEDEMTKDLFTDDGWLKTGDLGFLDENGFLFVKGRMKNVIIRSDGKNIYPEEIETIIGRQKYIERVLVYEKDGQIIAEVNLDQAKVDKDGEDVEKILDNIKEEANKLLPNFSRVNVMINRIEDFPITVTKKIKRNSFENIDEEQAGYENRIRQVYCRIFKKDDLDINASFFDLGLDSLDVMNFLSALKKEFPVKISITDLFANPSVIKLAIFLSKN